MNEKITMEIYEKIKAAVEKRIKDRRPMYPESETLETIWQEARETGMREALLAIIELQQEDQR